MPLAKSLIIKINFTCYSTVRTLLVHKYARFAPKKNVSGSTRQPARPTELTGKTERTAQQDVVRLLAPDSLIVATVIPDLPATFRSHNEG